MEKIPHFQFAQDDEILSDEKFPILSSGEACAHPMLMHYCSIETLKSILQNRTFRCTQLTSPKLNDRFEKHRKDVEDYANSCYISCFTHEQDESVPFWMNYGGNDLASKILLRLTNFAADHKNSFYFDYALTPSGGKYYLGKNVFALSYSDVQYVPPGDSIFNKRNVVLRLSSDNAELLFSPVYLENTSPLHGNMRKRLASFCKWLRTMNTTIWICGCETRHFKRRSL